MRVLVTIEGRVSVHEILEFEPQEDGSVLLTTHENTMDLVVNGMQALDISAALNELLAKGWTDLRKFDTGYDECFDDRDDDNLYNAVCPCCNKYFEFVMTPAAKTLREVRCPHCGEDLDFEFEEEECRLELLPCGEPDDNIGNDNPLEYETTCPQCHMTIDVNQKDVETGSMMCPICKAHLEFDAIDAENQTLGDYDDDEDNYGEENEE